MTTLRDLSTLVREGAFEICTPNHQNPVFKTVLFFDGDTDFYANQHHWTAELAKLHITRVRNKQKSLAKHLKWIRRTLRYGAKTVGLTSFIIIAPQLEQLAHGLILMVISTVTYAGMQLVLRRVCRSALEGVIQNSAIT